ncbi:hypothetical protein BH09VER1_BH09VER1_35960 [soil metagenome]
MGVSTLPYLDTKDVGAADFYFGINATFRFIERKLGWTGLRRYWRELGRVYFRPVTEQWKAGGLTAVANYWRDFFAAEPGAEVRVTQELDKVIVHVDVCPAIAHFKTSNRSIATHFCQHCHFVSDAIGEGAGLGCRVSGGNGSCRQEFAARTALPTQDLKQIALCS